MRTLIIERHSFKVVEIYFTDLFLYHDSLETDENLQPEEPDSGNEADTEPEAKEECLWEIDPLVTSIDKLDLNITTNVKGNLFINEDLDLVYFFCVCF